MSTQSLNQEWFNYPGVKENYRTMVYYPGTGGSTFEFNFEGGYINREDIKAFMVKDDDREAKYLSLTFKGPNTVQTSEPVPVGWTVCIFRDTPKAEPLAKYQDGAVITAENLDRNAQQAMFAVSEMVDRFDSTVSQVEVALKEVYKATQTADEALAEAKKATGIAQGAVTKADSAITTANRAEATANSASQKAEQASQTAIDAKTTATALDGQIKSANATAQAANQTAADAKRIAEGVDGKATQAQSDAANAVKTATEAKQIAQSIDAKATQAQKDAADALKKANEVEASVGTVQELSKRVKEFKDGDAVEWKGSHTFNTRVVARRPTGEYGYIDVMPTYTSINHGASGDVGEFRVGRNVLQYLGSNIHYQGYTDPVYNASVKVTGPAYPRISVEDTSRGYLTALIQNTDGQPFLEWKERGTLKGQFYIPVGTGTAATREWVNTMVYLPNPTVTRVKSPNNSYVLQMENGGIYGFKDTVKDTYTFAFKDGEPFFYGTSTINIKGSNDWPGLSLYRTNGSHIRMEANPEGSTVLFNFVSRNTAGQNTNGFAIPTGHGTAATREWVNSQGFVKSSGTQLGPVVTGNAVPLHTVDSKAMKSEAFEQIMSQVPWGAVFCGITFGNTGSIRSGAPRWRVAS